MKYAQQRKIPIVPVMITPKWRPSEWLGILTAGKLWTPLYDQSQLQDNLPGLIQQIKAAAPSAIAPGGVPTAPSAVSVTPSAQVDTQDVRSEIDSLRQSNLKQASKRVREEEDAQQHVQAGLLLSLHQRRDRLVRQD